MAVNWILSYFKPQPRDIRSPVAVEKSQSSFILQYMPFLSWSQDRVVSLISSFDGYIVEIVD